MPSPREVKPSRLFLGAIVATTALLAFSGCSSSDEPTISDSDDSSSGSDGTGSTYGGDTAGKEPNEDGELGDAVIDGAVLENCVELETMFAETQQAFGDALKGETPDFSAINNKLTEIAPQIPRALSEEFETYSSALKVFFDDVSAIGLDKGSLSAEQVLALGQLSENQNSAELTDSQAVINDYLEKSC